MLGDLLVYIDGKVIGYDEGIKLISTDDNILTFISILGGVRGSAAANAAANALIYILCTRQTESHSKGYTLDF